MLHSVFKPKSRREEVMIRIRHEDPSLKYFTTACREDKGHKLYEYQKRIVVSAWATIFVRLHNTIKKGQ